MHKQVGKLIDIKIKTNIKTSTTPNAHNQSTKPATKHTKQQPESTSPKHPNQMQPA
jgi:hypothetical protein